MSENPNWLWWDRWTGKLLGGGDYPAIWDEMETERFKPTILFWEQEHQGNE